MRFSISLLFLLGSLVSASAEFSVTNKTPSSLPHVLSCGVLSLWPPEREDDPINVISIVFGFDDNDKFTNLTVSHNSVFGRRIDRTDQYANDYLTQIPNKLEVIWRGSLKKKMSIKMTGRVWNEARNGRWYYSEIIEDGSNTNMKMLAGCRDVGTGD